MIILIEGKEKKIFVTALNYYSDHFSTSYFSTVLSSYKVNKKINIHLNNLHAYPYPSKSKILCVKLLNINYKAKSFNL